MDIKLKTKQLLGGLNTLPDNKETIKKFILITADFSGFGFVKSAIDLGYEVLVLYKPKDEIEEDKQEAWDIQGDGIFEKMDLDDWYEEREEYKEYYIIFDGNHNYDIGEQLIQEGFKVFGGSKLQYDCENDREFGLKLAESVGLHSPEYVEFTSPEDGISFLEENEDKAYVLKPNGESDSALTFCTTTPEPENANKELRGYIQAMKPDDYILQERVKGVEANFEYLVVNGEPIIAQINLECKKKSNNDKGKAMGCMQDVCWLVPLDCPLIERTVGKFKKYLKETRYTGFWDANVILGDDSEYFLEFCQRIGYNAHITFQKLLDRHLFEIIADMIDGNLEPVKKYGFVASVSIITDKPVTGLPIYYPESIEKDVYLFDAYEEDDQILMGGLSNEIAIITGKGYTIKDAFQEAISNADKVKFPNADYRDDGDKCDYASSPQKRYDALMAMTKL